MIFNGAQVVLLNQFDKSKNYYKMWPIEFDARFIARKYPNSYIITLFACCRELYEPARHKGGFGGTISEAKAYFEKLDAEVQMAIDRQSREDSEIKELKKIKKEYDSIQETLKAIHGKSSYID